MWLVGALQASPALADVSRNKCISAYESGQQHLQSGNLLAAREAFLLCGSSFCPTMMHADCHAWLEQVRQALPTVVFRARDAAGTVLPDAVASVDGAPFLPLDGRSLPLNPGLHQVVIRHSDYAVATLQIFAVEGNRMELHEVVLEPVRSEGQAPIVRASSLPSVEPLATETPRPRRSRVVWPWVASASTLALGAAGFAYYGTMAREEDRGLVECTPNCGARVDEVRRDYLLANVSLGLGLAGLLAGGALLLFQGEDSTKDGARAGMTRSLSPEWTVEF